MIFNKDNSGTEEDIKSSLDSAKRAHLRTLLYNDLYHGFGQAISSRIASSVVNALDDARNFLAKREM
jgi:hypothetical protein